MTRKRTWFSKRLVALVAGIGHVAATAARLLASVALLLSLSWTLRPRKITVSILNLIVRLLQNDTFSKLSYGLTKPNVCMHSTTVRLTLQPSHAPPLTILTAEANAEIEYIYTHACHCMRNSVSCRRCHESKGLAICFRDRKQKEHPST